MIHKLCPHCSTPLPILSGKTIICGMCKSKLVPKDGGALFIVLAILLFIPFKLAGVAAMMAGSAINTILIIIGMFLTAGILKHLAINYKVASGDSV